jgi:hypothetical protein
MSELLSNVKNAGICVLVGGAGLAGYNIYKELRYGDCPPLNPLKCFDDMGKQHSVSTGAFTDKKFESEDLTSTVSFLVTGEVTVKIANADPSKPSKMDYDVSPLNNPNAWPGVDRTTYWGKDGKAATAQYNPCVKLTDDKNRGEVARDATGLTAEQQAQTGPSGGLAYHIKTEPLPGPNQGKITSVEVDSAVLDVCFPRIPNTPDNAQMYTVSNPHPNSPQVDFPSNEANTFRWMNDSIVIADVQAGACPEAVTDTAAVEQQIKTLVLGQIVAKKPALQGGLTLDMINFTLQPPSVRKAYYDQVLADTIQKMKDQKETLPDGKGETFKLSGKEFGELQVQECKATQAPVVEAA